MIPKEQLERQLDDFDRSRRREALTLLWRGAQSGDDVLPEPGVEVNLHAHTFFSYNAYGYSPSKFAWLARKAGLAVAGIVDFDVLDGADEFLEAGRLIGLKNCASVESRVFVPEFATHVINSPGEPGVAYHMGVGFPGSLSHPFLTEMRSAAQKRTRDMLARVNAYLDPVQLDFERDVTPLTPNGNATERHLCEAYERKAIEVFADAGRRAAFWTERLGDAPADEREIAGADPRQDDEAGRRRIYGARQRVLSRNGEDEPFRRRSGGDSDHDVARRRERGRTADGGVRRSRQVIWDRGAERHSGPQLHARPP